MRIPVNGQSLDDRTILHAEHLEPSRVGSRSRLFNDVCLRNPEPRPSRGQIVHAFGGAPLLRPGYISGMNGTLRLTERSGRDTTGQMSEVKRPLGVGAFMPPLHDPRRNPTLALRRDIEMVEYLDGIGFDEVWFGEHHGLGWETSGSPEIMIAAAAERTARIKLGTGVISLPYHHPLLVADRLVLLDHLTHGRMIFGLGPGAFPSDATMMGFDYQENRDRMVESLEAILALLASDEPVSMSGKGFTMNEARLNLRPFSFPCFEIAVASVVSPTGPRLAGKYGLGLLSLAANRPEGWDLLRDTWQIVTEEAAEHGQAIDRAAWRSVGFFHIADTEAEARRDVRFGLRRFCEYFNTLNPFKPATPPEIDDLDEMIDHLNDTGYACIGSPDRLQDSIQRIIDHTGGIGKYVCFLHEMADFDATRASLQLMASTVMPWFQFSNVRPQLQFEAIAGQGNGHGGSKAEQLSTDLLLALEKAKMADKASHGRS